MLYVSLVAVLITMASLWSLADKARCKTLCVVVVVGVYLVVRTPSFSCFLLYSAGYFSLYRVAPLLLSLTTLLLAVARCCYARQTGTHAHARRLFKASPDITGFDSISKKKKMIRVTYRLVLGSDVDYDVNKEAGDVTSGQMTGRTVRSHVGPSRDSQTNATFPL